MKFEDWRPTGQHAAMDGSFVPHTIASLSRASWAVVFFHPVTGERLHSATGPVWASLPQSSQSAEYVAMAVLAQLAHSRAIHVHGHSDCKTVVTEWARPPVQMLRHSAKYAGILRATRVAGHASSVASLEWTRSHRSAAVIADLEADERAIAAANAYADDQAKEAIADHDSLDPRVARKLEDNLMKAKVILKLACLVLPLLPHAGRLERQPKTILLSSRSHLHHLHQ